MTAVRWSIIQMDDLCLIQLIYIYIYSQASFVKIYGTLIVYF